MERTRWYKNAIIYQIYPFSFMDSNNDGIGDIQGIISKLDYLVDLGINAIWFSPLYDSPNHDFGYDIRDYYKITPHFGSIDDFKELIDECHKRNIKVIMDMVLNHTSNEHKWFIDAISNENSKYRNYYIIKKGIRKKNKLLPPNNWTSSFIGSAWENIKGTDDFYLHLFSKEQPDLNWESEDLRNEIINILNYYLDLGVDGFRFDVFNIFSKCQHYKKDHNPLNIQKGMHYFIDGPRMHEYLKELYLKSLGNYDSYTVGESYMPSEIDAFNYIKEDNKELDTIFNFEHFKSDRFFGLTYLKRKFSLIRFKNGIFRPQLKYFNSAWNTLVLENHDTPRAVSKFGIDYKNYWYEASTFLPLITYFMWGTPFIYQGQEIGTIDCPFTSIDEMKDPVSRFYLDFLKKHHLSDKRAFKIVKNGARDHARCPMQWSEFRNAGFSEVKPWMMVNPTHLILNYNSDINDERSVFRFYQKVIKLKKEDEVLIYGNIKEYSHNNKRIIAYTRSLDNINYLIIGNFSNKNTNYKIPIKLNKYEIILSNYEINDINNNYINFKPYQALLIKISS